MLVFWVAFVHVPLMYLPCTSRAFQSSCFGRARVRVLVFNTLRNPLPLARRFRPRGQALVRLLPGAFARHVGCDGRDRDLV